MVPTSGRHCSPCSGSRQSPIDIKDGDVKYDDALANFTFTNYDATDVPLTMTNNGHSVKVSLAGSTEVKVSGGSLGDTYRAVQFHFHWGSSSAQGSEHLFNNHAYPMELHIVHYNTKYADIGAAVGNADGLAVLGYMFEVTDQENSNYADLVSKLSSIKAVNDEVTLNSVAMETLLPSDYQTSNWYRYLGSLTTPQCNEVVTWTVMTQVIPISETQMAEFRKVLDTKGNKVVDNYRPVQPLTGRVVSANYKPELHWGYATEVTPDKWEDYYGSCGGDSQSPIDIPKFEAQTTTLPPWVMTNYDTTAGVVMEIQNNGHTAKMSIKQGLMTVSGGDLPGTYKVLQLHWHWGSSREMGSEHLLQGKAYPMELHIVHYLESLDVNTAVVTPKGLAVLGFFFEEVANDNPNYDSIVAAMADIKNKSAGDQPITAMRLDSLIPGASDLKHYYRYSGSLTTPGCYESVIWTVFTKTIPISRAQLDAFRGLLSSEKDANNLHLQLVNNFRPPQPLNARQVQVSVPKWTYFGHSGPAADAWGDYYPYCEDDSGSRQSPINIDPTTVALDSTMGSFKLTNWDSPNAWSLANTGHSVNMNLKSSGVTTSGGGLGDVYELAQFHFHWGAVNGRGSEHLIDNAAYPMEVHFVHFNKKYGTLGNAVAKSDGLAVLGFMFQISVDDNPAMEPIVSGLSSVINPNEKVDITGFVADSILPTGLTDYYRYLGSLTTPGCYESVTWTVFREYITISDKQMKAFRALVSSEKDADNNYMAMVDNYRPVQSVQKRQIKATFLIGGADVITGPCLVTLLTCLTAVLLHHTS